MRTRRELGSIVAVLAACAALVATAGSEMLDLDPALGAKVAREKVKARAAAGAKGTPTDQTVTSSKDDCGVNIGNVDTSKQGPGKAIGGPRENTVVITGPVVNLGKCK